jgi:phosphatidate cytidylyltransferase
VITTMDTAPFVATALGVGGVGVWATRKRELILRWCTWAAAAPLVGGALLVGAPGAAVLAAGLAVVGSVEFGRLVRLPGPDRVVLTAIVAALPFAAWLAPALLPRLLVGSLLAVAAVPMLAADTAGGLRRLSLGGFGVLWLAGLTGLVLLGPAAFALVLAVSVADVAAYCGGRWLRGPLLSPLSPAKRWSGVLVGALVGLGALALFGALTAPLAVAVALGAPAGDLLESMVKRGAGAKDAGTWLPGFGGLLDRIDSLLIALVLAVVLS